MIANAKRNQELSLARLLFGFGIVDATIDDCEQQISTVELCYTTLLRHDTILCIICSKKLTDRQLCLLHVTNKNVKEK